MKFATIKFRHPIPIAMIINDAARPRGRLSSKNGSRLTFYLDQQDILHDFKLFIQASMLESRSENKFNPFERRSARVTLTPIPISVSRILGADCQYLQCDRSINAILIMSQTVSRVQGQANTPSSIFAKKKQSINIQRQHRRQNLCLALTCGSSRFLLFEHRNSPRGGQ